MAAAFSEVRAGRLKALFGLPAGIAPFPGLIVLHEAWGINDDIREIAKRLNAAGYVVLAPALYSVGIKAICIARTVIDMAQGSERTAGLVGEARTWLAAQSEVDGERIGIVGFCMGGGFALAAALRHEYQAASVNYGRVPEGERPLDGICPVVASYGERQGADPARQTFQPWALRTT